MRSDRPPQNQLTGNVQLTVPLRRGAAPGRRPAARRARKRTAEASAATSAARSRSRPRARTSPSWPSTGWSRRPRPRATPPRRTTTTRTRASWAGSAAPIDEVRAEQDLATVETQLQATWAGSRWRARRSGVLVGPTDRSTPSTRSICRPLPSMSDAVAGARANGPTSSCWTCGPHRRRRRRATPGPLHALPGRGRDAVRAVPGDAHCSPHLGGRPSCCSRCRSTTAVLRTDRAGARGDARGGPDQPRGGVCGRRPPRSA